MKLYATRMISAKQNMTINGTVTSDSKRFIATLNKYILTCNLLTATNLSYERNDTAIWVTQAYLGDFYNGCMFVKNSVYLKSTVHPLINHVPRMKHHSKHIFVMGKL